MRHYSLQLLCIGVLSTMLLVGCNTSDTATSTPSGVNVSPQAPEGSKEEHSDLSTYGQITSIDGNSITVALGTKKERQAPEKQGNGEMSSGQPEHPSDAKDTPPSDSDKMPKSSDDANSKKRERPSMLDLTGESKTVTLTDSTTITIQSRDESKTGTVSDLQVGDTISFDLASDGTTVTALKMQSMGHKKETPAATNTPK